VALPPDLPAEAKAAFSKTETCIACQYQLCFYRFKNECEWSNGDNGSLDSAVEEAVSQQNHEPVVPNGHSDKMDLDDGNAGGSKAANLDDYASRTAGQSSAFQSSTTQSKQYVAENHTKQDPQLAASALDASTASRKVSPAEVEGFEKMEGWEMAPGATKDETNLSECVFALAVTGRTSP
jgi:hypothetical protein